MKETNEKNRVIAPPILTAMDRVEPMTDRDKNIAC